MLFLLFKLGNDRYAIDIQQVVEVLPLVAIKQIPQAPAAVCGALDYHGSSVPLIDLSQMALGRPALPLLSTRIILVDYPDSGGGSRLLGLLAEHVTETASFLDDDFKDSGVTLPEAAYLGRVATDAHGLVQWIRIDKLLSTEVRDRLFQAEETA